MIKTNRKMNLSPINLVCPQCKRNLKLEAQNLLCSHCLNSYEVKEGIPYFEENFPYFGEISRQDMEQINKMASSQGWEKALEQILKPKSPTIYEYVVDISRANLYTFFPNLSQSRILDLGCGWGSLTFLLAPLCEEIVGVDAIPERIDFCRIRQEQENIENVQLIVANVLQLPFPEESFEIIIANGLLEWIGINGEENPKRLQNLFLKKIFNLLKPEGKLYIGIENRYGFKMWMGAKDHSGIPFTSLMPRMLANFLTKLIRRGPFMSYKTSSGYRTYTYSCSGYKRLLSEAGFTEVEFFIPLPWYNKPAILIPLNHKGPLLYYLNYLRTFSTFSGELLGYLASIAARFHLAPIFSSDFCIIATKGRHQ